MTEVCTEVRLVRNTRNELMADNIAAHPRNEYSRNEPERQTAHSEYSLATKPNARF